MRADMTRRDDWQPNALANRWEQLVEGAPDVTALEAAQRLEVSRLELRATQAGRHTTWLRPSWQELVEALPSLGPVEVTTRNRAATHVKRGVFEEISFEGPIGLVLGEDIDLRLFTHQWAWGVAVHEPGPAGRAEHVIEIYDRHGEPVIDVALDASSDEAGFARLVEEFAADDAPELDIEAPGDDAPMQVDDVDAQVRDDFLEAWRQMEDTHEFFPMLREHELERRVAVELAAGEFTTKLPASIYERLFEVAAETETPLMVFVGSAGCVQIHTGQVRLEGQSEAEARLSGPHFEMRVALEALDAAWVVEKPTVDGIVTSAEFFDTDADLAFQVFGERKPGRPELAAWREVVAELRGAG